MRSVPAGSEAFNVQATRVAGTPIHVGSTTFVAVFAPASGSDVPARTNFRLLPAPADRYTASPSLS